MGKIRTKRGFEKLSDVDLSKTTGKVATGLDDNEPLSKAPVPSPELTLQKGVFDVSIINADKGGSLATARKNALRAGLIVSLNKDASYVDINCGEDLALLLSSGFEAVSNNRAQTVLNAPRVVAVELGQAGELKPRVKVDANTRSILARIKLASATEYGPTISFASSRDILFGGLTAGASYVFQLRAVGGSTGHSDWSDPSTGMPL